MSSAAFPAPAWLVGCGNMGQAMVAGWRRAGVDLTAVTVIRPSGAPIDGVRVAREMPDEAPRLAMLGVKPQKLSEVAPDLEPFVGPDCILLSILAGTSAGSLRRCFPRAKAVVRAMPNLPVAHGRGVTALYSEDADDDARATVGRLASALGLAPWCEREEDFAAIGAVAGSGPAYVARFAEGLARGGERLGLDPTLASAIAAETLVGTAALAATGEDMTSIARRVASPGGTTEQGLAVLDETETGLQPLVDRLLDAAIARGAAMAEEARRRG